VGIPPLLSQFLQRRRAKLEFPARAMEELGLDRPALFFPISLSYRADARGASAEELRGPYASVDRWRTAAERAAAAGLVEEVEGRWRLTAKGRALNERLRRAASEHYAGLEPVPLEDLRELADLLERAFRAAAHSAEPARRDHTPWAFRYRGEEPPATAFATLDNAVFGLWMVRDDCHAAAWRQEGMDGPTLDVLTRLWRSDAADEDELAAQLPDQRHEDVRASLERLRSSGLVSRDRLLTTAEGRAFRRRVEDETDRLFFRPWPEEVGRRAMWVGQKLAEVNTALA
jgi:hypothetical protein